MTTIDTSKAPAAILTDLVFWTIASAAILLGARRLADSWGAPEPVLLAVSAAILLSGVVGLALRSRLRGSTVLQVFGWANLVMAPTLLAVALLDVLGLTQNGNAALAVAAGVAVVLGAWQLVAGSVTSRRRS